MYRLKNWTRIRLGKESVLVRDEEGGGGKEEKGKTGVNTERRKVTRRMEMESKQNVDETKMEI